MLTDGRLVLESVLKPSVGSETSSFSSVEFAHSRVSGWLLPFAAFDITIESTESLRRRSSSRMCTRPNAALALNATRFIVEQRLLSPDFSEASYTSVAATSAAGPYSSSRSSSSNMFSGEANWYLTSMQSFEHSQSANAGMPSTCR